MNTLKYVGAAVSLVAGLSGAPPVLAFETGDEALGSASTATDVWKIECPAPTFFVVANVRDLFTLLPVESLAVMRVGVTRGPTIGYLAAPNPLGIGGLPSPNSRLVGGPGIYYVHVIKTLFGADGYRSVMNCHAVDGSIVPETGTVAKTQNQ